MQFSVSVSIFEIYNERIYDLLGEQHGRAPLQIKARSLFSLAWPHVMAGRRTSAAT